MIERIGSVSPFTIASLRALLASAEWEVTKTDERDYSVWFGVMARIEHLAELTALWPRARWHQAFFLSIPPGGKVHRHRDTDDIYTSFHIPVTTNPQSICVEHRADVEIEQHLDVGTVYAFDRTQEHSSRNDGSTERTHLIMEILK